MHIGVPKERRPFEFRVGLPPAGVNLFTKYGHTVYIETEAGEGAGFTDDDYSAAGGQIVYNQEEVFGRPDLIMKFARPLRDEIDMMRPEICITGFLHLAASRQDKIESLLEKKISSIAYEQVEEDDEYKPILTPLSQIGGRMAIQVAARFMQNDQGGRGILLGGAAGVPPAEVVIIGAGVVGSTAADSFTRIGAHVTLLDTNLQRLREVQERLPYPIVTMLSTPYNVTRACLFADVLIGSVLVPGSRAPFVVTRETVQSMKPRALIIDMSIDQGGCVETSRPTNHGSPIYEEERIIHYCVPNMSGVLGRTASHALFLGAYPYLEAIALKGIDGALADMPALHRGLNTRAGEVVHLRRLGGVGEQNK